VRSSCLDPVASNSLHEIVELRTGTLKLTYGFVQNGAAVDEQRGARDNGGSASETIHAGSSAGTRQLP
jgi:hypothetical protein